MKIKSILFPVDFSDRCVSVIPHVEAAARRFGASITLLHMVEPLVMPYGPIESMAFSGIQPESLIARAEVMLEDFGSTNFAGLRVQRVVSGGDPAMCIASVARDRKVGL